MKHMSGEKPAAQGDLIILPQTTSVIPEEFKVEIDIRTGVVVAHSETGHHHVLAMAPFDPSGAMEGGGGFGRSMAALTAMDFNRPEPKLYSVSVGDAEMVRWLIVPEGSEARLEHHRPHDTHETIMIPPGTYKLVRQQRATVSGWEKVSD